MKDLLQEDPIDVKKAAYANPYTYNFPNNDGYLTLTLNFVKNDYRLKLVDAHLKFWDASVNTKKAMSFNSWCRRWSEFIDTDWKIGYQKLLKSYNAIID